MVILCFFLGFYGMFPLVRTNVLLPYEMKNLLAAKVPERGSLDSNRAMHQDAKRLW